MTGRLWRGLGFGIISVAYASVFAYSLAIDVPALAALANLGWVVGMTALELAFAFWQDARLRDAARSANR